MRAGFTLVEVMVAVAVASLLILGVAASTQSSLRTAECQKADSRTEEGRARAVELFRQDWRGRLNALKPRGEPLPGTRLLALSTTGDSVSASGARGITLVTYAASEKGLSRKEGEAEILLVAGPVRMDFWDGVAWRTEPVGQLAAVRLGLQDPEEWIVLR